MTEYRYNPGDKVSDGRYIITKRIIVLKIQRDSIKYVLLKTLHLCLFV